jgi:outer membrane protein
MKTLMKFFGILVLFGFLIWLALKVIPNPQAKAGKDALSGSPGPKQGSLQGDSVGKLPAPQMISNMVPDTAVARLGGIAYVRSEAVATQFNLMVRKRNALQARLRQAEKEWESQAAAFQKEIEEFQRSGAAMGESQRSATEQSLARKEQNLMQMRQGIMEDLSKSESTVDQELRELLDREFELYSKARGYRYLMARQAGSGVLYGDSLVDVTDHLIAYLNARYP